MDEGYIGVPREPTDDGVALVTCAADCVEAFITAAHLPRDDVLVPSDDLRLE